MNCLFPKKLMKANSPNRAAGFALLLAVAFTNSLSAQDVLWRRGGLVFGPRVMQFSPDGRQLFTAGDHGIKVWDTATGAFLDTWTDPGFGQYSSWVAAVSSDGREILWGGRNRPGLNISRLPDGALVRTIDLQLTNVNQTAWSPDGRWLAIGSNVGPPSILRLDDGQSLAVPDGSELTGGSFPYRTWTFVSANDLLVGGIGTSERWQINPAKVLWKVNRALVAVDPARGRGLAATATEVEIINLEDGSTEAPWPVSAVDLLSAAFSTDGTRLALGRINGSIEIRQVDTGELLLSHDDTGQGSIYALGWNAIGSQMSVHSGTGLHLWEMGNPGSWRTLATFTDSLRSIAFSPDGSRILAADTHRLSRGVVLLDATTGTEQRISEDSNAVGVGWPYAGSVAVLHRTGDVVWHDPAALQPLLTNHVFETAGLLVAAAGSARVVATDISNHAALLDARSGQTMARWEIEPTLTFRSVTVSPEGTRTAAVLPDRSIRAWEIKDGQATELGRWEQAHARFVQFEGNRGPLWGGPLWGVSEPEAEGSVSTVWRWRPGSPVESVDLEVAEPQRAAFSPNFTLVLVQDGTRGIAVCRTDTGRRIAWVTDEAVGSLHDLKVSAWGDRWIVSRVDGVSAVFSAPMWLTSPRLDPPGKVSFDALGLFGRFQVEQRSVAGGAWTSAGAVQEGPRLEVPAPGADVFWRARLLPPD